MSKSAFHRIATALAALIVCASTHANESEDESGSVDLGAAYFDGESRRFGEFTGVDDEGGYALLDVDFIKRIAGVEGWLSAQGRDLGLDSREALIEFSRPGFDAFFEFSQLPRHAPLPVDTGLAGIGSPVQIVNGVALRTVDLSTTRDRYTVGFDIGLPSDLSFDVRFRDEAKEGVRHFGRGTGQFLAEPIDSRTRQVDASLNYAGRRLQLSGGYYGAQYSSAYSVLDVDSGTDIALPPDNQSHQLMLSGGYSVLSSTRATFKASYGRLTQDDAFYTAPTFAGNTQTSLDARIDTTTAYFGLSGRPARAWSWLVNLRYEDRDDKTPRRQFITASPARDGFNTPLSRTLTAGKLEATYSGPWDIAFTGGVDAERRKRSVQDVRQSSWRKENDEVTYRIAARRYLSATLSGSVSYAYSEREGSAYLPANNNAAPDVIDPIHFADRTRDRARLLLDYSPIESLSLQLTVDRARDRYASRALGPERGSANFYSLDASYELTDRWRVDAWASRDETRMRQATETDANGTLIAAQTWRADLRDEGEAFGVGLRGQASERLDVGADVHYQMDAARYGVLASLPTPTATLPDIESKRVSVEVFGNYALREHLGLRMDVGYRRFTSDDWTWTDFVYADGTTLFMDPRDSGVFIGLSVRYTLW